MVKRPGGSLSVRPLNFIWICDTSGSMSVEGKIQSLNAAIREALPHMVTVASENPNANVLLRVLKFSHGAEWYFPSAIPISDFQWKDLVADPLQQPKLDIVFLVDTSGSMSDEIDAVKRSCVSFADQIIKAGANVRLGLVGFDIGGHRGSSMGKAYKVYNLSRYTIGVWPLNTPERFKKNIQSLSLGLFGGGGCYLAQRDTVDIFPHVINTFDNSSENTRILVIISDEMGGNEGLSDIVSQLKSASITSHVLGVSGREGAHKSIARMTGGEFWNITKTKGVHNFEDLLGTVADTIAKEVTQKLADGTTSSGTDMGTALKLVSQELKIPPMNERALPPVLVLISDGQPTDDFQSGLDELMKQPWGKKAVRIAIAIGKDADEAVLQKFIGHTELKPLQANNPEALFKYIKWSSTIVLKAASSPVSQTDSSSKSNLSIALPPSPEVSSSGGVW
ncbi:vWA domain-containing protein [Arthrospira platensis]|jgi:uncharacterized protein YegL|nr:VWA domain-containing protein [Arthrospira platensis]AMW31086.1 hypothetical protein AP285_27380 [Arthrospira platensis YZ]MDF2208488.1 VWA domain-containing protein [Arthrospira platensis NCB002]WAK74081.1 VWA domain-containing protein [Arthrospira sp. PCC 9108]BAI93992.1 hypothetical protein NIES39_P00120 [Arthrospira platensis NIES-39]